MPPIKRHLTRKLALTLAALACACLAYLPPASRRARAQDDAAAQRASKENPQSAVYGRAVYADTERPVRRGRVRLLGVGGDRVDVSGMTDGNGEFRIKGVRAGSYFIMVDVAGLMSPVSFVGLEELRGGTYDTEDVRKYFDVIETDGKEDKHVAVRARRGSAITGKVAYTDGEPAVNLFVQVMRRSDGRLVKFFTGTSGGALTGMLTDDRGAYRVAGLPPGEYVVSVSESADHGDGGSRDSLSRVMMMGMLGPQLLTTFYPSATRAKDATVVKVGVGDERGDIDISIPDRATHAISGVVRSRRDKRPLADAQVNIVPNDHESGTEPEHLYSGLLESGVRTDEQGRWQLKEIPDGPYTITVKPAEEYEPGTAYASMNSNATISNANVTVSRMNSNMNGGYVPPRPRKRYAPARQEVKVSGDDVTELAVELSEGASVSGTLSIEGGKPPEYAHVSVVSAASSSEEIVIGDVPGATARGGEFRIEGLSAGKFFLHPNTYTRDDAKLYLKSITWNGKDLLREPLDVAEGASIEGVRVIYSTDPAKLLVRAVSADKKPALNVNIFLVPADAPDWSPYSAQSFFCSTGEEGACSISAPPGEYAVVVLPRRAASGVLENEIKTRAAASPRVTLRGGETKTFEARVAER